MYGPEQGFETSRTSSRGEIPLYRPMRKSWESGYSISFLRSHMDISPTTTMKPISSVGTSMRRPA